MPDKPLIELGGVGSHGSVLRSGGVDAAVGIDQRAHPFEEAVDVLIRVSSGHGDP
jgi:hypothetical protein